MASELNKNDIASELSFFVNNPYYLSKAAEISACQDNLELSQKLIKTIDNEWFSSRAIEYGEQVQEASDISSICINFDYKEPVSGKCEALEHLCSY